MTGTSCMMVLHIGYFHSSPKVIFTKAQKIDVIAIAIAIVAAAVFAYLHRAVSN